MEGRGKEREGMDGKGGTNRGREETQKRRKIAYNNYNTGEEDHRCMCRQLQGKWSMMEEKGQQYHYHKALLHKMGVLEERRGNNIN